MKKYTIDFINTYMLTFDNNLDDNIVNYLNNFVDNNNMNINTKLKSLNNKSIYENKNKKIYTKYTNKSFINYKIDNKIDNNNNTNTNTNTNTNNNNNNSDNNNNNNNNNDNNNIDNANSNNYTYNINRSKEINSIDDFQKTLNNGRKLLNKLSSNNYKKISQEFLCFYNIIKKQYNEDKDNLNKINDFIFELLIYGNFLFINDYYNLFILLVDNNEYFSYLLNYNINKLLSINNYFSKLDVESISFSKNLDKLKSFILFYCLCFNKFILPSDLLIKTVNNLQNQIISNIENANSKYNNEIYSEFIFIIIKNCFNLLKNENNLDDYKNILEKINNIINKKNNIPLDLNNKIIFKHMDIYQSYNVE